MDLEVDEYYMEIDKNSATLYYKCKHKSWDFYRGPMIFNYNNELTREKDEYSSRNLKLLNNLTELEKRIAITDFLSCIKYVKE